MSDKGLHAVELLARLASLQTVVAGFVAANAQRQAVGASMAYGEEAFNYYATLMEQIASAAIGAGEEGGGR